MRRFNSFDLDALFPSPLSLSLGERENRRFFSIDLSRGRIRSPLISRISIQPLLDFCGRIGSD